MEFDSKERPLWFYVVLFGLLIFSIVFFAHNVKKAINSNKVQKEVTTSESQTIEDEIVKEVK